MDHYSPLRYPGGKRKVAGFFKHLFSKNNLYDGVYVEPYAGGASVALSLLFNEYASRIIINDKDAAIYAFWYSAINETEQLCRMIRDTPITLETWRSQKKICRARRHRSLLKLGFAAFFLNRTNRSGILNGGVIGGVHQDGEWKIDARFNKEDLIRRIERIAEYRDRIELYNQDAIALTHLLQNTLPTKSLFYFDPPYFIKGQALYLNYYDQSDHETVATVVTSIKKQKWVVTYDNVAPIRRLYKDFRKKTYHLNYSAAVSGRGEEIMIFSEDLAIGRTNLLSFNSA